MDKEETPRVIKLMCKCPSCGAFADAQFYESMDPDGGAIICSICKEEIPQCVVHDLCEWVKGE